MPDANSIWNFREALTRATLDGVPAIEALFRRFDARLRGAGYIAMGGRTVDATMVAAPRQRNTEDEKRALREGRVPEDWAKKPAKLRQKDRDARWTVKYSKATPAADGAKRVDIAVPMFGYKMGWLPPSPDGIEMCQGRGVNTTQRRGRRNEGR